ncbi:hypothetical protein CJ671_09065 [Aliarcobacter cryaerophilus]|uniref:Uncharacterized protein n=1 Tax=Aliarcobacter cryaerophilus TaxID=28198 RepID=A0A2S9SNW6_9BACT|nr:hypothetical protein [Aliarcobacter cryaerophilus]PRM88278.1 hypothetical protein CJ671_09065 [Aliarcobacter cryaerophilus]
MSNNEKYTIKELSFEEMLNDLSNTSPLMMSKKLIEYELYDQQDSIEVLNSIYEEFENNQNIVDELVTPIFFNICDGIVKHPKLGLAKSGITATSLLNEIKYFDYEDVHHSKRDMIQDKKNLDENTKTNTLYYVDKNGQKHKSRYYARNKDTAKKQGLEEQYYKYEDTKKMKDYKNKYLKNKSRDEYTNQNDVKNKRPQPDHIIPLEHAIKEYGTSKFLTNENLKNALNEDNNFAVTNGSLNQSKGSKTNLEAVSDGQNTISAKQSDATKQRMIQKGKEAKKEVEKDLNNKVFENLKEDSKKTLRGESKLVNDAKEQAIKDSQNKALGEIVILLIKPIYYELNDIFKNGMIANFNVSDKIEAFILRMKRVKNYVMSNAIGTIFDNIKDFLQSFVTLLLNGIVNAFVGLLKKILQVISEGFTAIVEAFKIMMKPDSEVTLAQKADAITKIIASAVVPILIFSFEETILAGLKFLNDTPLEFLKDVAMIILSGIATTLVVWILDQIDLFSVKAEKRLARVKEIFELRIETIKQNTDIFEKTSIETLAKQKLQFKNIIGNMNIAIDNNQNINQSVYEIANFMEIDLKVKSTDEFLNLLSNSKELKIN